MNKSFGCLIATLIYLAALAISWGITSLIIMALCWLFSVEFSIKIATGVWLAMLLLKSEFSNSSKS